MHVKTVAGNVDGWSSCIVPPGDDGRISIVSSPYDDLPKDMFSCDLEELLSEYIDWMVDDMGDSTNEMILPLKDILDRASKKCQKILSRKLGSPIEEMFWSVASDDESEGFIFGLNYQYQVENYILDFAFRLHDFKLAIELDGHDFHKTKEQRTNDAKRARRLSELGWDVIRFTGSEIFKDANRCVMEVKNIIYKRTNNPLYET